MKKNKFVGGVIAVILCFCATMYCASAQTETQPQDSQSESTSEVSSSSDNNGQAAVSGDDKKKAIEATMALEEAKSMKTETQVPESSVQPTQEARPQVPSETKIEPSAAASSVVSSESPVSASAEQKTVTLIEVKGNKSISANKVIANIKTTIGGYYLENVISDDLKRLYALGYFSDIKVDTEDYKGGIKVVITVVERPIIEKINFAGMKRYIIKDEKLKKTLKSQEGQYLDYPTLSEDIQTLRKMYEKKGFGQVQIEHQVEVDPATNKAKVLFNVNEGGRIKIKNIFIEGNISYPDARILKLIKTKRAWLFNAGVLKEDVLKEDMDRIKAFYKREGYADVEVSYEIKKHAYRSLVFITIKVVEGKKYLVGSLVIKGNKDIPEKDILPRIQECVPGKVFSQEAMKKDIANIQSVYFDRGYISVQIQETTYLNPHSGRIDISYSITENEIAYVNKIKVRGNVKTKDIVIRREMRLKPGDRFDGEKLKRSKERLQNLGFFEDVSYDTEDTDTTNKKDLIVDVKEAKTGALSFGGGYSSVDKLIGFVEVEQKNFDWKNFPYFTGDGQNLRLRASLGSVSEGFDLSYTEPWMFDYPVSFGFDGYKHKHSREQDIGYGYDEDIIGGDLRLGKELSEYVKGDITYRYDSIKIADVPSEATADLKSEEGKNDISSMSYGLEYDDRDNINEPTKGNYLRGELMQAGGIFGGDKDFVKFNSRASHYFPLFRGSVFELRGRLGIGDAYGNSSKIPIYERFFAGGANSIRGYRERKIGPVDAVTSDPLGGESMLIGNAEYTYPLLSFFRVAAFYDIGNVWEKANDIGTGGFKSGTGVGVRIKTPIGPLMLDYGIPLNKEPGSDSRGNGRLHFSMSHGF